MSDLLILCHTHHYYFIEHRTCQQRRGIITKAVLANKEMAREFDIKQVDKGH